MCLIRLAFSRTKTGLKNFPRKRYLKLRKSRSRAYKSVHVHLRNQKDIVMD